MSSAHQSIPPFALIIGAAKCGTTSLFEYLSQHPEIARCRHNEPCFFSRDRLLQKGIDWYESLWDWNPRQHRCAVEASTNYTKIPAFPNVAERIAQFDRSFQFLYIVRHPIDRIESHITHGIAAGWMSKPEHPSDLDHAINVSRYAMQLSEYEKRFPEEDLMLLDFDHLTNSPRQQLRRIFRFLDVNPNVEIDSLNAHNTSADRKKDHRLVKKLREIQPVADFVKQYIPRSTVKNVRNWMGTPMKETVRLTDQQRQYVLDRLTDDLTTLENRFGFPVEQWSL